MSNSNDPSGDDGNLIFVGSSGAAVDLGKNPRDLKLAEASRSRKRTAH